MVRRIATIEKQTPATECSCETCQKMCEQRPCWGTLAEMQAIIDAGYGDRLMLDWWDGGIRWQARDEK